MDGLVIKNKLLNAGYQLVDIAEKVGITPQDLQSKLKSKDVKSSFLVELSNAINESVYYFLDEGIIKPKINKRLHNDSVTKSVTKNIENKKYKKGYTNKILKEAEPFYSNRGLPLIPIDAMAGFGVGEMQVMDYETSRYVVPEFEELHAEFMIRVKGSSMYPKYNSGDLLACKKLALSSLFFQWNKVYVLDTVQGAIVKRVKKSSKDNCVKLISDNPNYDPFDLPVSEIHSIALVIGVIRME